MNLPSSPSHFPLSYSDALTSTYPIPSPNPNSLKSFSFRGDKKALYFSDQEITSLSKKFDLALVGKFTHGRPNVDLIRKFFVDLGLLGHCKVGILNRKCVLLELESHQDYIKLFKRRNFVIQSFHMRIFKWSPNAEFNKESPIMPIWMILPELRLQYFTNEILLAIGNMFGRALQVDKTTLSLAWPSVAKVLVEIDISIPYDKEIWLGTHEVGYWQKVHFDKIPQFCHHCSMIGHDLSKCFKANGMTNQNLNASNLMTNVPPPVIANVYHRRSNLGPNGSPQASQGKVLLRHQQSESAPNQIDNNSSLRSIPDSVAAPTVTSTKSTVAQRNSSSQQKGKSKSVADESSTTPPNQQSHLKSKTFALSDSRKTYDVPIIQMGYSNDVVSSFKHKSLKQRKDVDSIYGITEKRKVMKRVKTSNRTLTSSDKIQRSNHKEKLKEIQAEMNSFYEVQIVEQEHPYIRRDKLDKASFKPP